MHCTASYKIAATADGTAMEYYRYTPYGVGGAIRPNGTSVPAGSELTDRLYTGQRWDPSTQLYDYPARLYDPFIARFLSIDPVDKLCKWDALPYNGLTTNNKRHAIASNTHFKIGSAINTASNV